MDYLHAIALAVLQGVTEFLPISSSAHLVLLPVLLGWDDQGLAFDVAVHVGTLLAVMFYFRKDVMALSAALIRDLLTGEQSADSRLARSLIVATVPIVFSGLAVYLWLTDELRDPLVIATTTMVFGLLLWFADHTSSRSGGIHDVDSPQALLIGMAQVLALIPGVSRSGVTMTAALAIGLSREAAARFSFLLSIPVILSAGVVSLYELLHQAAPVRWSVIALGVGVAAVTAYLCIHYFLKLVERVGLVPFVIYRVVLALYLFWVFT